jgi:hypothetical protein
MTNKEFRSKSNTNAQYKRIIWLVADFGHKENIQLIFDYGYPSKAENRVKAFNSYFLDKKSKLYIK